ncbi:Ndd1p SCDLUD_004954 [Saccharomycodes ludwigii]|uniref:Ndd1p n=1 Tax=Saccharomycodes ludwigii TaxID=36035 RepID=UPI001E87CF4D|nr:hypothetical protein SCDLUD_004954 [Saccharomycodes ludwigii]KAH3899509.1 hypothetical protein SCDLUD_004954 [Saccharomycodes ludwigii]
MLMGSPLMIKTPAKKTPLRFQTTGSNAINYNGSNNIFNVNDSSVTKNILGTTPLRNLDLNVLFNLGNSNNKKITPCRRYLNLTPFNKNLLNNNNSNSAKSTNNASNNSNNIIMKFMTTNNNSKPQGECTPLFDVEKSGGVIIRTENTPTLLIDDDSSQNLNADILGNSTVNKVLQQQSHKIIERTKMVNEDANNNDNLKLSLHLNDSINNTNETQKRMNNIILNENAHIPSLQISEATAVENDDLNSSPTTIQLEESAVKKQPADLIPASPSSVFLLRELTLSPTPRTKVKRNKKRNNNGGEEDDVSLLTKKMGIDEGIPPAQIMIPPLQKAHTVTGAGLMELHSSNQSNTEDEGVDEGDVELKWKEDVKALRLGNNANKVLDVVPELPKMGSFNISKSVVTPINKNTFTNASKKRKRSISNNSTNSSVFTSFSNKKKKNKKKNCNFSSNKKNNKGATNNRFHIIVTDPNMFGPALPAPTKKSRRRTLSLKRSKSETFGDSNKKGKEE